MIAGFSPSGRFSLTNGVFSAAALQAAEKVANACTTVEERPFRAA
jgi:hypothetical protein